ncbi:hypothetical protein QJS66_22290 [Kocuria rhizophila]|nr:hypothetical protein QJS66_22290 [Kocuria rhizophila]
MDAAIFFCDVVVPAGASRSEWTSWQERGSGVERPCDRPRT